MRLLVIASLVISVTCNVTNIKVPLDACLRVTGTSVNVRDTPCGTVIGSATLGQYYDFSGGAVWCSLSGTNYHFHEVDFGGRSGWLAGTLLEIQASRFCGNANYPASEFRAVWLTSVYNLDWPKSSSDPMGKMQQDMIDLLDMAVDLRMNAVVFQIRPAGDALYNSPIEPWSRYLTGTQGTPPNPLWDPLEFTIQEARQRGLEVHAWLNPYRASLSASCTSGLDSSHMAMRYPQYAYVYGSYCWMDPGAEVIVQHLEDVINDLVNRYDLDGIHFDDYFYPYPSGGDFPDDTTWNEYVQGGGSMNRGDWRRDNVNSMVQRIYNAIKAADASVEFSISPFGIYRPGHAEGMPSPIAGLDPYTAQFADSKLWLQQGWVDHLDPQLYWQIYPPAQSYTILLDWWSEVSATSSNRYVYAGVGVYRLAAGDGDWPAEEFENQVDVSRLPENRNRNSRGNIFYRAAMFENNMKGISDLFRNYVYTSDVPTPSMAWLNIESPLAPAHLNVQDGVVNWQKDHSGTVRFWLVFRLAGTEWELVKTLDKDTTSLYVTPGQYSIKASNNKAQSKPVVINVLDPNALA